MRGNGVIAVVAAGLGRAAVAAWRPLDPESARTSAGPAAPRATGASRPVARRPHLALVAGGPRGARVTARPRRPARLVRAAGAEALR